MMVVRDFSTHRQLAELLRGFADLARKDNVRITGITADSRFIRPGYLFLALQHDDVASHINMAVDAGAAAVVLESVRRPDISGYCVPLIALPELRAQAGLIAARFFDYPSRHIDVMGITGTNGKTTVAYLIARTLALQEQFSPGFIGTLGYGPIEQLSDCPNTTPEPVTLQNIFSELYQREMNIAVVEVSSHGLDQHRVIGVEFDVAVFTNLERDHLDYHLTMDAYAGCKRRLFRDYSIKKAIINIDDEYGLQLARECRDDMDVIGYTLNDQAIKGVAMVSAKVVNDDGLCLDLQIDSPWGSGLLSSPLAGRFNASNLLASLSALCISGMAFNDALSGLSVCSGAPGRMEFIRYGGQPSIVIDYAHTASALKQVLKSLRSQSSGRVICVFGCGGQRDKGKRAEMGRIAEEFADHIFVTSDNPRHEPLPMIVEDIIGGMINPDCVSRITDRREAITAALRLANPDDLVLIAGKGHENYQDIAGVKLPFNDRAVVDDILHEAGSG